MATNPTFPDKRRSAGGRPEKHLVKACDKNIQRTLKLTHEMILLANQGDADREDTACGILYGVMRDAAYKLQQMAETEKKNHQAKGWWDSASKTARHHPVRADSQHVKRQRRKKS